MNKLAGKRETKRRKESKRKEKRRPEIKRENEGHGMYLKGKVRDHGTRSTV